MKDAILGKDEEAQNKTKRLFSRTDEFNNHFNNKQSQQNCKYRAVVNVENNECFG